ncbi:MAG: DUF2934 domain-containing protein [Candidatus Omnitrophica bacterium]|nr:DUF2934 domain-containing protein [Candidatus Omnitrophota bacterium]
MAQATSFKRTAVTSHVTKEKAETPVTQPSHTKADAMLKKIQEKAYDLYLKRNGAPGSAEQDWAEAEKIVKGGA